MEIGVEEVMRLARLARLELEPGEVERMRRDLAAVLGYVGKLSELDTSTVPPTAHVLEIDTPLREDDRTHRLEVVEAVRNAPQHDDFSMIVPRVIE